MPEPQAVPVYIPSWGRAEHATTPRVLDWLGIPYRLVVEADQWDAYAARYDPARLLLLDPAYIAGYDALGDFAGQQLGPGPARNFIWDHAQAAGRPWFWMMDDNITLFVRMHRNRRVPVADGTIFAAMEDFCARYANVALAGPDYVMFQPSRAKVWHPFTLNTRVYSCQLHRTDVPLRYRGRYNDDEILSLDLLKAGYCTVLFNTFLQRKAPTQTVPGGCHEAFYAVEGTLPKSAMLVRAHPDVARLVHRFGRWHHEVDHRRFLRTNRLEHVPGWQPPAGDPYRMREVRTPDERPMGILGELNPNNPDRYGSYAAYLGLDQEQEEAADAGAP